MWLKKNKGRKKSIKKIKVFNHRVTDAKDYLNNLHKTNSKVWYYLSTIGGQKGLEKMRFLMKHKWILKKKNNNENKTCQK